MDETATDQTKCILKYLELHMKKRFKDNTINITTINSDDRRIWQIAKDAFDSDWIAYFFKTELERLMLQEEYIEALQVLQYYYV